MALTPIQLESIQTLQKAVRNYLIRAEAGHDWWHISRVYQTATMICEHENVDRYTVLLAALLHDIADPKFNDGNEDLGPEISRELMSKIDVPKHIEEHVVNIIKHMSFKNSFDTNEFTSMEMKVVQDADRLDAIGAVGIARAFSYGGYKGRVFFDPKIAPIDHTNKESYKKNTAPTINHFYEKLLKLKDGMHTSYAKKVALERHRFMVAYLDQFYVECGLRPFWDAERGNHP